MQNENPIDQYPQNLSIICDKARDVITRAVEFIRIEASRFEYSQVQLKGFNDLVSYVDKTSEKMLVEGLSELLPGSGFITEENTSNNKGEHFTWIIDPLDGTTNFVHGVPCYCVSVALLHLDETVMGIIHEVNQDECFYSWKGGDAFLNGKLMRVSERVSLTDSLIVTGFPYTDFSRLDAYMQVFDFCMKNTHGVRRPGSAAVDLAYVAAGRFEAFFEYGLNSWDVAAGAFLVQQAGGIVSDFNGGGNYLYGKEIIASSNKIYPDFLEIVKQKMKN